MSATSHLYPFNPDLIMILFFFVVCLNLPIFGALDFISLRF